uniref:F-box domain-containing protein n=1 Tax=Rhodosorus marinus TaxID=101924 RepID=A0A7S3A0Q1_9RHOD|mmetsp:Transcript_38953/g.154150  ORF Transcript_38953/g.154150 Transcript_38953/m.154150 type:complete len:298 (+) Transcript_38953:175-1068(+)
MENFPDELLVRIAQHLPKRDAWHLSMCSKGFHASLKPWLTFLGTSGEEELEMNLRIAGRNVLSFGPCAVSADGRVTAVIVNQMLGSTVYRIDTESKEHRTYDMDMDMQTSNCVEVSYSGRTVAVSGGSSGLVQVFTNDNLEGNTRVCAGGRVALLRISPDEKHVAIAFEEKAEVLVLSVDGGETRDVQFGRKAVVPIWYGLDFTREGDLVATLGTETSEKVTQISMAIEGDEVAMKSVKQRASVPHTRPQHFNLLELSSEETEDKAKWRLVDAEDITMPLGDPSRVPFFFCTKVGNR